jgi:hypothetical protein
LTPETGIVCVFGDSETPGKDLPGHSPFPAFTLSPSPRDPISEHPEFSWCRSELSASRLAPLLQCAKLSEPRPHFCKIAKSLPSVFIDARAVFIAASKSVSSLRTAAPIVPAYFGL